MADFTDESRDHFAALAMAHLAELGRGPAVYDAAEFTLELPDGWEINLTNIYRETYELPADARAERLTRFLSSLPTDDEPASTWEQVRPRLRPILRPVTYAIDQAPESRPLARPAFPFLSELVAVDKPDSRTIVANSHVAEWGVTPEQVFDAARENLAGLVRPHDSSGDAILRYVDDGNAYFTSWPLAPGWLASFRARYGHRRPVAFMPDNDSLIVVPDAPQVLGRMYELAEEQYRTATRPLSPQGYTLDDTDAVVPFDLAGPHEQLPAAHRARCGLASAEYTTQTGWLNQAVEDFLEYPGFDLEPAYAAELKFTEGPDGPRTITIWCEGVEYLLPEAEYVAFGADDGAGGLRPLFEVPFDAVAALTGLTPVPGLDPPRYEARSWPTPDLLTRLSQAATTVHARS
ncbi:hypothetical protein [Nocardia sp. NPDC048505]|uniref:hypothetical protein n=1 Tax=unclassified Nocardia TaxID=2637762 RepID=UPI0033DC354F